MMCLIRQIRESRPPWAQAEQDNLAGWCSQGLPASAELQPAQGPAQQRLAQVETLGRTTRWCAPGRFRPVA